MASFLSALVPVLVSAAIAAWVAWHASKGNALMANVTQERAKWRERIRQLADDLQDAVSKQDAALIRRVRVAFRLSLNPWDDRDREIVALLERLVHHSAEEGLLERIVVRLELLLKHDWERAKAEATWRGLGRQTMPARRAASPRAGVDSLAKLRTQRPLAQDFQEAAVD
jgi:hypothetical protein